MKLLQRNFNSISARYEYLKILTEKYTSDIICLQERNFKANNLINLSRYKCYFKNGINSTHDSGGVVTYIHNFIPSSHKTITTELEVVTASVILSQKIDICNIYIPNSYVLCTDELNAIFQQIHQPCIIIRDFNSHNPIRGSNKFDPIRGKIIED